MTTVTPSCSNNGYYAGILLKATAAVAGITLVVSAVALTILLAAPVLPAILVGAVTLSGFSVQSAIIIAIFSATFMAISLGATRHINTINEKNEAEKPVPLTRSPTPDVEIDEEEDLARQAADVSLPSSPPSSTHSSPHTSRPATPVPATAAAAAAAVVEIEVAPPSSPSSRSSTPVPAAPKAEEQNLFDSENGLFTCDCSGCGLAQKESSSQVSHPETPVDSARSAASVTRVNEVHPTEPDLTIAQVLRQEQILTDNAVGATERVHDLGFLSAV